MMIGYRLATYSHGGSPNSMCMALMQGSGVSPGVWIAVSTVIVRVYKCQGFGAQLVGGWSQNLIGLSALLHVDDTDLLHNKNTHKALTTHCYPVFHKQQIPGHTFCKSPAETSNQINATGTYYSTGLTMI